MNQVAVDSGVLLVDKPAGPTSHDMVDRVRRLLGTRRVGHTGTLETIEGKEVLLLRVAREIFRGQELRSAWELDEIPSFASSTAPRGERR